MEDKFLNDKECRVFLSLGTKGSGKTTTMLNYLKYSLENNKYSQYHLVLPQYSNAKHDSESQYGFLKGLKNIFIYTKYDPVVSSLIKKAREKEKDHSKKFFYAIDDATSYGIDIKKDENLLAFITTTRHINLSVWLLLHAARSVLSVPIRSNADYLFIHKISNRQLFEAIYEEFFSMITGFDKFNTFRDFYNQCMSKEKNALFYSAYHSEIDGNVIDWKVNKYVGINHLNITNKKTQEKNNIVKLNNENFTGKKLNPLSFLTGKKNISI